MKITMLAVAAFLSLGALQVSAARQDTPQGDAASQGANAPQGSGSSQSGNGNAPAKQDSGVGTDAKDAGKSTGAAAKDTGKIVATDTKKGVHKAASGLGKVADKFRRKSDSSKTDNTTQTTDQPAGQATGNGGAGAESTANGESTADGNTKK